KAGNRLTVCRFFTYTEDGNDADATITFEKDPVTCILSARYARICFATWFVLTIENVIPGQFLRWHDQKMSKDKSYSLLPCDVRINDFSAENAPYLEKMYLYFVNCHK